MGMWQMATFIRHNCGEGKNNAGQRCAKAMVFNLGSAYPWGYISINMEYTKGSILVLSLIFGVREYQKVENRCFTVQYTQSTMTTLGTPKKWPMFRWWLLFRRWSKILDKVTVGLVE